MKTVLTAALTAVCVCAAFWWLQRQIPASRSDPPDHDALVVFDAAGKRIGRVAGIASTLKEAQVSLDTPLGAAILSLRPDGFFHPARPFVYFDTAECHGNPFIGVGGDPPEFGVKSALAGDHRSLYVAKQRGTELVAVKSVLRESSCEPFEHEIDAVAAEPVMDLAEEFAAPFSIERTATHPR